MPLPSRLARPVPLSRRSLLTLGGAATGALLLPGCASGGSSGAAASPTAAGGAAGAATLSLQTWGTGAEDLEAVRAVVANVQEQTGLDIQVNEVALETFRAQLPTYLSSNQPPDMLKWLAGSTSRGFSEDGLLLDVSDLWEDQLSGFSPALRELSTNSAGEQYFVPTDYYWWGMFYLRSTFEEYGYTVPETWDEFTALCEQMEADGLVPIEIGTNGSEWVATAWFDYINLRLNGAEYHRELLVGEHAFTSPEVRRVYDTWAEVVPYFSPNGSGQGFQDALTPFFQQRSGMFLIGAFLTIPEGAEDDVDFFPFPELDPAVGRAEEAPTDGLFASARTSDPDAVKQAMAAYVSPESQELLLGAVSARIGSNPDVPDSFYTDLVAKGREHLETADAITQFFDRDSSQELGNAANQANAQFLVQPDEVDGILDNLQVQAERIWAADS